MTRREIDAKVVEDRLALIAEYVARLREIPLGSREEFEQQRLTPAAAESFLRRAIEALFDLARHLLARGCGEAVLEHQEVARRARERGLITSPELGAKFRQIAGFRNRLTHAYQVVRPAEIFQVLSRELPDLEGLAAELRAAADRLLPGGG